MSNEEELPPTEKEIDDLHSLWDAYAPKKYKGMTRAVLLAYVTGNEKPLWVFDGKQYIRRDGVIVSLLEARDALREFSLSYGKI